MSHFKDKCIYLKNTDVKISQQLQYIKERSTWCNNVGKGHYNRTDCTDKLKKYSPTRYLSVFKIHN